MLGLTPIISGVFSLSAAFLNLTTSLLGLSGALGTVQALTVAAAALTAQISLVVGAGVGLGYLADKLAPNNWFAQLGNWIGGTLYQSNNPESITSALNRHGLRAAEKAAIMANIFAESSGNPIATSRDDKGNTHFGLFQFGPEWQEKYTEWADTKNAAGAHYNRFLSRSDDPAEQIDFFMDMLQGSNDPGMRRLRAVMQANRANGAMGANEIAQTMALEFERPFAGDKGTEEANKRGTGATVIYNSFHITESNDPHKTANAVKEIIDKTHRDAARDFVPSGVIQ
jgi:hypothetical protein